MTGRRVTEIERPIPIPPGSTEVEGTREDDDPNAPAVTSPQDAKPTDRGRPDPHIQREWTRVIVTGALTALLFFVVLTPLVGVMFKSITAEEMKAYYSLVLAPVFSVYSSIITFYFVAVGSENKPPR